jgi:tetratricopeptide (TPR) repeat protein
LTRSVAVKVRELLAGAQRYRDTRRWEEALKILREAQQLDTASVEIPGLIAETERQQNDEIQEILRELRVRAAQAFDAGDLKVGLQLWREVLTLNVGDATATRHIDEILERQRIERLRMEVKQALDQGDYSRASRLMAELQGSPIKERPWRKRSWWPWMVGLVAVAVGALFLWIWIALPSPNLSKGDAVLPSQITLGPAKQSPPGTPIDLEAHFKQADQDHEQGMYDAAIAEYDAILKSEPGNARAIRGRARALKAKEAEGNVQK